MIPGLIAGGLALALALGIALLRRFGGQRMSIETPFVLEESALTVIDRVEAAVAEVRGYACERQDREVVIFRKHHGPLGFFDHPEAPLSEATMDLLHVTAQRVGGRTEVWLRGRSEPRVINRVRRAISKLQPS